MLLIFNESIDLNSSYDRLKAHSIIDEMYYLVLVNDDEDTLVVEHEYIDLDSLSFNHDLTIHDFDLMDVSAEELEKEREELHALISKKDEEGLVKYFSNLPIEFKRENAVSVKELLESGRLEEIVADHIAENYDDLYVEHSKSCVASNSFYIKNEDDEVLLKISDHNTIFQEVEHRTPFINVLGEYGVKLSLEEVLDKIDNFLKGEK